MKEFDVVVVGAGPAGGQCARELGQKGHRVLLVDKAKSFLENNYSSGGAPAETMTSFQLPDSIVGTFWNTLNVISTKEKSSWHSPSALGPVIDFDKLRSFLSDEVLAHQGDVRLGFRYVSHQLLNGHVEVSFKDSATDEEHRFLTRILVDATGTERKVLSNGSYAKDHAIAMTGIEHHIQVDPAIYQQYAKSLNFFLGHHWMPQGYGWIFPMAPNKLKVGVIRYFQNKNYVTHTPSYKPYLDQLLGLCGNSSLLDSHGKTLHYSFSQKDLRTSGPIIAVGDAISSVNPLGCEGIRHALVSGRLAANEIDLFLSGKVSTLKGYDSAMKSYFGWKWKFSEWMMRSLFTTSNDRLIDLSVKSFQKMTTKEILDVVFNYRFSRSIKSYFWYFISLLNSAFQR